VSSFVSINQSFNKDWLIETDIEDDQVIFDSPPDYRVQDGRLSQLYDFTNLILWRYVNDVSY
jgi:hypothetical protein